MSARRSNVARRERHNRPQCRKCESRNLKITEYPDEEVSLVICQDCKFPFREKWEGR